MKVKSVGRQSWFGQIRVPRTGDPDFDRVQLPGRVRGRRRYYRALRRKAENFSVRPTGSYDYMHWHVDWRGLGNLSWRERREHLSALFTLFTRLLAETSDWSTPHQAWLVIDAQDGSQDAVYLHTGNPNADNFPNRFVGAEWDVPVPDRLREFVTDPSWQFGRIDDLWTHFFVRPRPAG